ncbi:Methionyl-tRNA formyltransferase [Patulibacter medicamentivorans]|uniref:Methionyl-tRNA formyltransferase n=1 Tax=Patulibacter medicamentivorans TaxID=1097667 RepID=H0E2C5_9ACTN|nr:methionyl-tRNA formyltransferase [Patulibacter medicamentivorans]EHN12145.1 Methionyl-tRNA formyltransferase [Patulibacter medicamentivorans]
MSDAATDTAPRTVLLGTSWFAADLLRLLAAAGHAPALVVTRPDRPAGRGRKLTPPPVAEAARELGIPLFQPDRIDEPAFARIAEARPDAVLVCAYGAIIREPLLSAFPMLNVHPSLLPRWRGAAPVERAIMAGDRETGVSIMGVVEELDAGPVYLQETEPIAPDDSYGTLAPRLVELSAKLLVRALEAGPATLPATPQPDDGVTYAEKIAAADRDLDPAAPARVRHDHVRALAPHIGARLPLPDGSKLGVLRTRIDEDGELELLEVQPPGGRPMAYADYLRGQANR